MLDSTLESRDTSHSVGRSSIEKGGGELHDYEPNHTTGKKFKAVTTMRLTKNSKYKIGAFEADRLGLDLEKKKMKTFPIKDYKTHMEEEAEHRRGARARIAAMEANRRVKEYKKKEKED